MGKRKKPKIGRGRYLSIAKAALVAFVKTNTDYPFSFIYSGILLFFHDVIDIAGAKHCSFFTHHQVLSCINASPFWEQWGTIPGWGERKANAYRPSKKGYAWIEENAEKEWTAFQKRSLTVSKGE